MALKVEAGEGRTLALLVAHSFFLGLAWLFMETAADAIFLAQQPVSTLPYVFIGIGVFGAVVGIAVAKLEPLVKFKTFLSLILFGLAVSVLLLWLATFTHAAAVPIAIAIWNDSVIVLGVLEQGALAGRLLNIRQAKRLYAVIGCGEAIAGLLGGLLVPPLVAIMGTDALLLLTAGSLAVALAIMRFLLRMTPETAEKREVEPAKSSKKDSRPQSAWMELRDRYLLLIIGVAAFEWLVYYLLQTAFLANSQAQFPSEDELAGFFGVVFGLVSLANLLFRTLLASRFLSRYGVVGGLILLPALLIVGAGATVFSGIALNSITIVFWAVVGSRLIFALAYDSVAAPSRMVLLQALTPRKRVWAQAFVETICMPVVTGLAGVVLIGVMRFWPLTGSSLLWLVLVSSGAWMLVSFKAGRQYAVELVQALSKRSLRAFDLMLSADATTAALLEQGLSDPHPGAVIYCLNNLEQLRHDSLESALVSLLQHPAEDVRIDALEKIERLHTHGALEAVQHVAQEDASAGVRAAALKTLVALGETDVFDVVSPYLEDPDPQVTTGALVGMLLYGGIEGVLVAGETLMGMIGSTEPARRVLAAQALGSSLFVTFTGR